MARRLSFRGPIGWRAARTEETLGSISRDRVDVPELDWFAVYRKFGASAVAENAAHCQYLLMPGICDIATDTARKSVYKITLIPGRFLSGHHRMAFKKEGTRIVG
jgi:hypothetical protein